LLAPLRAVIGPIVTAFFVVLLALAAQVLLYVASAVVLLRSRPAEFIRALTTRGPLGLLGYCRRALLQSVLATAFGRTTAPPQQRLTGDLRQRAARLQSEIAMLRADFAPRGASPAAS